MAARYATDTFTVQLPSGASHTVIEGSLRDSAHAAVTAAPGLFTTTAPVLGKGHVNDKLYGRLLAYPAGTEA